MLKPEELNAEHLSETYTLEQLKRIAAKDYGLELIRGEKEAALISRILAAAIAADPDDQGGDGEDQDGLDAEDVESEGETPKAPAKPLKKAAHASDLPPELVKALTPFVRDGLKFRANDDGTFFMKHGNREDSGTLNQPVSVIVRCAKRVMG